MENTELQDLQFQVRDLSRSFYAHKQELREERQANGRLLLVGVYCFIIGYGMGRKRTDEEAED